MHPSEILFQGTFQPASIPACDHYAGSEKLMRKSMALQQELGPVFDITFDCEDGASTGNEKKHAVLAATLINSKENLFNRIGARVHDTQSAFFENDVATICQQSAQRLAYIVIPKAETATEVQHAIHIIQHHAKQAGRANLPVHILIETHSALAEVRAIAALPEVECLSFGIMDFVSSHYGAIPGHAMRSPGQFTHHLVTRAKIELAAACHQYGKVPSHNVTTDIQDMGIIADDARRAANEFGFTRMWSIHPNQVRPILNAFTPATDEVNDAIHILSKAKLENWGPTQYKGTLHDRASYRYYWTILQRAKSSGFLMTESALALFE